MNYQNIAFVILAAGKGTRMHNEEIPKPLQKLAGCPLISFFFNTLESIEISKKQIWIVTHHHEEQIKKAFPNYQFAHQQNLDGTAGAARDALKIIPNEFNLVAIFSSDDTMFYKPETISDFIESHLHQNSPMSLLTVFKESDYLGGLVRDEKGQAKMILAAHQNLEDNIIKREIICGGYVFNRAWLSQSISKLSKLPNGEIGLPYLVNLTYQENRPANVFQLKDPNEWMGVNTPEELEEAERRISN